MGKAKSHVPKKATGVPSPAASSSSSELSSVELDDASYSTYSDSAATGGDAVEALGDALSAGLSASEAGETAAEIAEVVTETVEEAEIPAAACGPIGQAAVALVTMIAGAVAGAPPTAGGLHCAVDGGQGLLHVCYRDASGNVWDTYTNGDGYQAQQLAGTGGLSSGAPAACDPQPIYLPSGFHVFYFDGSGDLWHLESQGSWTASILAGVNGATSGPVGTGSPSAIPFSGATCLHVGYCDQSGNVWDVNNESGSWVAQQATGPGGLAGGPAAVDSPTLLSVDGGQVLFCYFDADANLQAGIYNFNFQDGWETLQLAGPGSVTGAP